MPPTLLTPDRQDLWAPRWVLDCASLPARWYATGGDLEFPVPALGTRFADGRLGENIQVSKRLLDTFWGPVTIADVSLEFANADGALSGDYAGAVFTLYRYDVVSGTTFVVMTGEIIQTV